MDSDSLRKKYDAALDKADFLFYQCIASIRYNRKISHREACDVYSSWVVDFTAGRTTVKRLFYMAQCDYNQYQRLTNEVMQITAQMKKL